MADSVQYAIDIAARMSGSETFAQLDQLTASLANSGKGAEHFGLAAQRVATSLQAAQAASSTAGAALAQGNAQWRDLEQALVRASRAAERAAKSNDGVIPFELAAAVAAAESNLDAYKETLRALAAVRERRGKLVQLRERLRPAHAGGDIDRVLY